MIRSLSLKKRLTILLIKTYLIWKVVIGWKEIMSIKQMLNIKLKHIIQVKNINAYSYWKRIVILNLRKYLWLFGEDILKKTYQQEMSSKI